MPALAIRGIHTRTARKLKELARQRGVSVNRLVVSVLERATHTASEAGTERELHHDLDDLLGTWTEEEHRAFSRAIRPFEAIDEELWRGTRARRSKARR